MSLFDTLRLTAKRQLYSQLHEAGNRGPDKHLNEGMRIKDRSQHRNRETHNRARKRNCHGSIVVRDEREFLIRSCSCVYVNKKYQQHDGGTKVFQKGDNGVNHKNP